MWKIRLFFIISPILFCPVFAFGAVAITPPDHFVGDGTLGSGTASLIKINIIDEEPGIYYLKTYFYPPSKTQSRFGYVWNSTINRWISTWQKNSEQLQIEVAPNKQWNGIPVKGLWQGEISVKTDIEKSGFLGSGDYILKVRATAVTTGHAIEISTKTSIVEPSDVPKATNSIKQITNNETPTTTQQESVSIRADRQTLTQNNGSSPTNKTQEQAVKPSPLPNIVPNNIFLSEILPSPEGSDTENEFIEIFNANNFTADIPGFKIKDKIGVIKTFTIPVGTKILSNSFLAFKSSQTKISLNNSGDSVELIDPNGKIIDSTDFGKSQPGQSWSKVENTWAWTAKPTPNQANIFVATQIASTSSAQAISSKINPLTANIQNYPPQRKNFLAIAIAIVIALASAFIAWQIKKKSTEI